LSDQAQPSRSVEPYRTGSLPVSDGHSIFFEESGRPDGLPAVYLHGGPGGGIEPEMRGVHNPDVYRVVMFDQRGAGRSTPSGETRHNTLLHLVADMEALRQHLGLERWIVSGGSWGTTVALAYAQTHPERCLALVLRGVFLGSQAEMDWFNSGLRNFYPDVWDTTLAGLSAEQAAHFPHSLDRLIDDPDPAISGPAAVRKARYEWLSCSTDPSAESDEAILAVLTPEFCIPYQRVASHYGHHQFFLQPDQLLNGMAAIRHLPGYIVNGRMDVVCPPMAAYRLKQAWPEAELHLVPMAGHFSTEPGIRAVLCDVMARLERLANPSTAVHHSGASG
jgi:proline iminopeptidase